MYLSSSLLLRLIAPLCVLLFLARSESSRRGGMIKHQCHNTVKIYHMGGPLTFQALSFTLHCGSPSNLTNPSTEADAQTMCTHTNRYGDHCGVYAWSSTDLTTWSGPAKTDVGCCASPWGWANTAVATVSSPMALSRPPSSSSTLSQSDSTSSLRSERI